MFLWISNTLGVLLLFSFSFGAHKILLSNSPQQQKIKHIIGLMMLRVYQKENDFERAKKKAVVKCFMAFVFISPQNLPPPPLDHLTINLLLLLSFVYTHSQHEWIIII